MRREGSVEYLRVLEVTKKGWPHYHLLVRSPYLAHRLVRDTWAALTGATICDVRAVKKADNVYWYLVKYLGKQLYCDFTDRRVSQTAKFFTPKTPYPSLELIDYQPEMQTMHRWLRSLNADVSLTPIGHYMWQLEGIRPHPDPLTGDRGGVTPPSALLSRLTRQVTPP